RSVEFVNALPVASVKFHNTLVCRGTGLAALWRAGGYAPPGRDEYVAALVNIDPVIVGKWAEDRRISFTTFMDLSQKREVADLVRQEIESINARVEKEHFKIRRYAILYKLLDVDDGELTKTGKIRREFVQQRYQSLYEALYDTSVQRKKVSATYQYQDGQTTTVETEMEFYPI
ncbi:MAG: hypothetical protein HZB87_06160, partial [Desulfatitalea sp.]|nr:hypothetical protein [Desulfatitalea sp.]